MTFQTFELALLFICTGMAMLGVAMIIMPFVFAHIDAKEERKERDANNLPTI